MMYCAARSPPKETVVEGAITRSMVAFLATDPDHSTSSTASDSSLFKPGSIPVAKITFGFFAGRFMRLRKVLMSVKLMLLSLAMAMVSPVPSMPAE